MPSSAPTESLRGSHPLGELREYGGAGHSHRGWCRRSSRRPQSVRQASVAELLRSMGWWSFLDRSPPTLDPTSPMWQRRRSKGRDLLAGPAPVSFCYPLRYSSRPPKSVALLTISKPVSTSVVSSRTSLGVFGLNVLR